MGEAKRRGTYEERKLAAEFRDRKNKKLQKVMVADSHRSGESIAMALLGAYLYGAIKVPYRRG